MEPDDADTARWAGLQASIEGEVVLPGSLGYEEVNRPFNARFLDVRPQAVVRCATPEAVAETISFLGSHRLETATRSGGGCFAGHSSTRGALIDVTPMASVAVSGAAWWTVGARCPARRGV